MNLRRYPRVIFLDDGGVMNDNRVRGPQWAHFVGEFMSPRLGGTAEQWAAANQGPAMQELWMNQLTRDDPSVDSLYRTRLSEAGNTESAEPSFGSLYRDHRLAWVRLMCEHVRVPVPADDDALALETEASAYVTSRVRSAFPGAADAIRALHETGYQLHTASGEISAELEGYLRGMEVRECFGHLFGPDVIDVWKGSPEYYRRIFEHAAINPVDALVIDDSEQPSTWAVEAGARVVRITADDSAFESAPSLATLAKRLLG